MVVTRKPPVVPVPPSTSRTNSSQPLPRAAKGKTAQLAHAALVEQGANANGKASATGSSGPNSTSKNKSSKTHHSRRPKKPRSRTSSFLRTLLTYAFWVVTLYACFKCPSDPDLTSPVCHTLSTYRSRVLVPYVLPPLKSALNHPSVHPYVVQVEAATTPLVKTAETLKPYVAKATQITSGVVQQTYARLVQPTYTKVILPQYDRFVQPQVDLLKAKAQPYAKPAVQILGQLSRISWRAYKYAERYSILVYLHTKPYVIRGYYATKPHALQAWTYSRPWILRGYDALAARVSIVSRQLGTLRRAYVDPQVVRIWDKVGEVRNTAIAKSKAEVKVDTSLASSQSLEPSHTSQETSDAVPTPEPTPSESSAPPVQPTNGIHGSSARGSSSPLPSEEQTLLSAASVIVESGAPSSVLESLVETALAVDVESVEASFDASSTNHVTSPTNVAKLAEEPIASEAGHIIPGVSADSGGDDFGDEDEFLRDLGMDSESEVEESGDEAIPEKTEPTPEELEAAAAKRKRETSESRAKIVARHQQWQRDLDSLVESSVVEVREELLFLRENVIEVLKEGSGILGEFGVEGEGQKLLKGFEGYVKKLKTKATMGNEEERVKWEKVAEKVEARFYAAVDTARGLVHDRYRNVRGQEVELILATEHKLKSLADRAQADLGLDYTWLDDVTYQDWQNYHDLVRTYEAASLVIRSIQNGTHPDPVDDPLLRTLDDLSNDLDAVVTGFEIRARAIRREGDALFGIDFDADDDQDGSEEGTETEESESEYSILPVDGNPAEKILKEASQPFVGRGAEEVAAALNRAEAQGVKVESKGAAREASQAEHVEL